MIRNEISNKINLDFFFSNCTLESETCKYWIKLNEKTLEYCLIGTIKYNENGKIEDRYDFYTVKKIFINSIDLYSDAENDFIVRIYISGRENYILIPFEDSENAYNFYLKLKEWYA